MVDKRLLFLIFLLIAPTSIVKAQDYTPNTLTVDIFSDGSVNIDYRIEPDPTLARVNVSLFGSDIVDLLAVDQDGIILDWTQNVDGIEVDSIGAEELTLSYSSSSLTNKNGTKWSVSTESPVSPVYFLPKDAVLVGLSSTPVSISIVDNRAAITMPYGPNSISYTLGTTGTKEHAIVLLTQAETQIEEAKLLGLSIDSIEKLLVDATGAFELGSYAQVEQYSRQIIEQVTETIIVANQAISQITLAEDLLEQKADMISSEASSSAQKIIDEAKVEYDLGEYSSSYSFAVEAIQLLQESELEKSNNLWLYGLVLIIVLGIGGYLLYNKQEKDETLPDPDEKTPQVDLEKVFKQKEHLRTDEKAVLRFIQESNGAFITEIRKRFDIPKSTGWRMVKRLEEEGVIDVSRVGRETYLKLRNPEGYW